MEMAEDLVKAKGCIGIWFDTFDFQAPEYLPETRLYSTRSA
ncbi:MAG: hypothetical protein ACJARL_003132 [Halopseudomonas sp.]|jgi:hypothetical protein|tara:strand:+ start:944 stop:1066 length:123 start_codon:yes stop_codon:yes gene_type:complete